MDIIDFLLLGTMAGGILLTLLLHYVRAWRWRKTKNKEWWLRFGGKTEEGKRSRTKRHQFRHRIHIVLIVPLLITGVSAVGWLLYRFTSLLG